MDRPEHSTEDAAGPKIISGICLETLDLGEGGSLWETVTAAQHWLSIIWLGVAGSLVRVGKEAFCYPRDHRGRRQVKVRRRRDLPSQPEEERGFLIEQGSIYRIPLEQFIINQKKRTVFGDGMLTEIVMLMLPTTEEGMIRETIRGCKAALVEELRGCKVVMLEEGLLMHTVEV